ncbi:PREDICTED: uncharacterized protein LOC105627321 [Atta cephalotes]|uniref:MADF domain-containing protein n=1 Tax=Atta cephalotes TaxID=12957 RepID=A0A158P2I8_ATTCE|nr:PREDICTED: uncharacterized protein LOC105627321 [Atta cephalotes]
MNIGIQRDRDKMLINVVQTKPGLWNTQMTLSERTKAKKKVLWKEVQNILGFMTMDEAMKRWKYLRSCYVRYRRLANTYVPSGCAAQPTKKLKVFRFYELMRFIDDSLENARTVSDLSDCDKTAESAQEEDNFSIASTSNSSCKNTPLSRASRSAQTSTSNTISHEAFTSELRNEFKNVLTTPVPPKDAIDHFVACLADEMRKLSKQKCRQLQIEILKLLAEIEKEKTKGKSKHRKRKSNI